MDILDDFRLTQFEHEADCRHGLRAALCLQGFAWNQSDYEATRVVDEALQRIGAKRPTWYQGQKYYTQSPDFCAWCQAPMEETERTRSQRFCTKECAKAALEARAVKDSNIKDATMRSAYRLVEKLESPPRECDYCGKMFYSDRKSADFCSPRCVSRHQKGESLRQERQCVECGTTYKPTNKNQQCCSIECRGLHLHKEWKAKFAEETRVCALCDTRFRPSAPHSKYCSNRCARLVANRAYRARQGAAEHHLRCEWCSNEFVSKMPWAKFCCRQCKRSSDSFQRKVAKLPRLPVPDPRPLTPELVDMLLEAA